MTEPREFRDGLYEQVISEAIAQHLDSLPPECYEADAIEHSSAESETILSRYLSGVLETSLKRLKEKYREEGLRAQVDVCNQIISYLSDAAEDTDILDFKISERIARLLSIHQNKNKKQRIERPETPISISSVLTGSKNDPPMVNELKKEIKTSDKIDMIVSFIKFSGLRLILEDLKEFTEHGKLRVITTTYMGATDSKAILELSKLPNTEIKVAYNIGNTRLHAKSYIFRRDTGFHTAYVGSSNLSSVAITEGKEWNVKITKKDLSHIFENMSAAFETYWNSKDFVTFEEKDLQKLSDALYEEKYQGKKAEIKYVLDAVPYTFQQQILDELEAERKVHNRFRNLIVAATGTGKTIISAFDYKRFCEENPNKKNRLLFIAHRKEILDQSIATFRGVLKNGNFGDVFYGNNVPKQTDHLFMSVQTFRSQKFYKQMEQSHFDFIIVDETHHGAASSYQKIFTYYKPKILLGLTATPERMDSFDITEYFDNKIASEIRLPEAIDRGFLVPFQYFCISDNTDLSGIKFEKGRYDFEELNNVYVNNKERARLIINSMEKYSSDLNQIKALGFCVTQEHANFMGEMFNISGIPSIALTSQSSKEERNEAQVKLKNGDVKVIFTVDLYNEGVDIPEVNTVLFLRPTESTTVFVQQLGRGLRTHPEKTELTVFDFIGQANKKYDFRKKFESLVSSVSAKTVDVQIEQGFSSLPNGCYIQMERLAKEYVLNNLKQTKTNRNKLIGYLRDYSSDTEGNVTLQGFIEYSGTSLESLYSVFTFTRLCELSGVVPLSVSEEQDKFYRTGLLNLTHINSRRWISTIKEILMNDTYDKSEEKAILMFYYSFYSKNPVSEGYESVASFIKFVRSNKIMINEIIQFLDCLYEKINFIDKHVDLGFENALDLHCTYARDQILAGLGIYTKLKNAPVMEGVYYSKDIDTDIFFVTLKKTEREFSPTTMYEDYAISDRLFHWQSQSRTSDTSQIGLRYRDRDQNGHNVILFVRETKKVGNKTAPYTYLGKLNFLSYEGSKPMSIIWELEEPMPPSMLESARIVKE